MKNDAGTSERSRGIALAVNAGSSGADPRRDHPLKSCRLLVVVLALIVVGACSGGGGGASEGGGGGSQTITSISIKPDPVEVGRGSDETMEVTARTSDGDTKGVNNSDVDWEIVSSPDSPVASVTDSGVVTGKRIGDALIRAHLNEHTDAADLSVSALQVRPESTELPLDCRERLRADSVSSLGVTRDVTTDAEWSVSNDSIDLVTPDNSDSGRAEIQAKATGSAVVRAAIPEPGSEGMAGTARVEMVELSGLTGITLENSGSNEIAIDEKRRLSVDAVGTDDDWDLANCVEWSSNPTGKVSISADGVIRGLATGTTTIKAEYRGVAPAVTNDLDITVTNDKVTLTIKGAPGDGEILEEETWPLKAEATIESDPLRRPDVTDVVDWSSDRPEIASVGNSPDSAGGVKGLQADPEPVTITADMDESAGDCTDDRDLCDSTPITVVAPSSPTDLTMSAEPNVLLKGGSDSSRICARLLPNDTVDDGISIGFTSPDLQGATLDPTEAPTENGEACVTLISGSKGIIEVKATKTDPELSDTVDVEVVDDFANVFDTTGNIEPKIEDETAVDGTVFEAILRNGSNREFTLETEDVSFCNGGTEIPISNPGVPENNLITGGVKIRLSVELTSDKDDNGFALVVASGDPDVAGRDFELVHVFTEGGHDCT